jgi:hypothetical protein
LVDTVTDTPTATPTATTDLRITALEYQLADLAERLQLAEEQNLALEARVEELRRARIFASAFTTSIEAEASGRSHGAARASARRHAAPPGHLRLVTGGAS